TYTYIYTLSLHDALPISSNIEDNEETREILNNIKNQIDLGEKLYYFQKIPHLILLQEEFYKKNLSKLMSAWSNLWLLKQEPISRDRKSTRLNSSHVKISY